MLNRHSANLGQTGASPTPPQMANRCILPRARISRQETKPSGLPRGKGVQTQTSRLTAISRGSSILMIVIRRRWIGSTRYLTHYDIPTCRMYESLEASCSTSQSKSLLASRLADETSYGTNLGLLGYRTHACGVQPVQRSPRQPTAIALPGLPLCCGVHVCGVLQIPLRAPPRSRMGAPSRLTLTPAPARHSGSFLSYRCAVSTRI